MKYLFFWGVSTPIQKLSEPLKIHGEKINRKIILKNIKDLKVDDKFDS